MIKKHFKLISGICCILLGILSFVFAWMPYQFYGYEENESYGGDAYTGIQNAAASASRNVKYLGEYHAEVYMYNRIYTGVVFVVAGSLICVYDIADKKSKK